MVPATIHLSIIPRTPATAIGSLDEWVHVYSRLHSPATPSPRHARSTLELGLTRNRLCKGSATHPSPFHLPDRLSNSSNLPCFSSNILWNSSVNLLYVAVASSKNSCSNFL